MQKTFNVWVKNDVAEFRVCSKKVNVNSVDTELRKVCANDSIVACGTEIRGCDVSQWLETFYMKGGEVRSFKITFKEN